MIWRNNIIKPGEKLNLIAEEGKGKLYGHKGFLIPVLTGSSRKWVPSTEP